MKEVIVYVEGPSDKLSMEALLQPIITERQDEGVAINFFEAPSGDRKKSLLEKIPGRAVNILRHNNNAVVVAMPDLYPRNKGFSHETVSELKEGIKDTFTKILKAKGIEVAEDMHDRFKVFCFKYELEALLLAAEKELKAYLNAESLKETWTKPVENHNHDDPPKKVIERIFVKHGQRYKDTVDAPMILREVNYEDVAEKCPECFKPFVMFLKGT